MNDFYRFHIISHCIVQSGPSFVKNWY